jgi:exopolysaccharide biosynthesis polyprenyl glycosylphosphotransferase
LASLSSLTPIDGHRRRSDQTSHDGFSSLDDIPIEPISPADLREILDDHTRVLLQRHPKSRRSQILPPLLVIADLSGLVIAYFIATLLSGGDGALGSPRELVLFAISLPCWVVIAEIHGLYHRDEERADHSTSDDIAGVFHLVTVGVWLLLVVSRLVGQGGPDVLNLALFWLLAVCVIPAARLIAREAFKRSRAYEQNTVIVGAGEIGQLICRKLIRHPEYGANVVGFVDRLPRSRRPDLPEHLSILGGPDRLPEIIERLGVERVVIAFSSEPVGELLKLLRRLRALNVQIDVVPWLFELMGPRLSVHSVEGVTLLGLTSVRHSKAALAIKRLIDIAGSSIALIVLSPVMLYIAVRIRCDSVGPVLFRQTRLGAGMRKFSSLKFRTMTVDTDTQAHREYIAKIMSSNAEAATSGLYKLDRPDVITTFGRWLRTTSLDELPQLINILRGEMSLVGPRPCIPYEVEHFAPHHLDRFLMPQGLTGLWQVTARANSTFGEALDMDVAYVRNWSLGLDLRLLLRTPLQVLRQRSATT